MDYINILRKYEFITLTYDILLTNLNRLIKTTNNESFYVEKRFAFDAFTMSIDVLSFLEFSGSLGVI